MLSLEPSWTTIAELILRDHPNSQWTDAIRQMGQICAAVREKQKEEERTDCDLVEWVPGDNDDCFIRNQRREQTLREVVEYVADLGCDEYPKNCQCVTCLAGELRTQIQEDGCILYVKG